MWNRIRALIWKELLVVLDARVAYQLLFPLFNFYFYFAATLDVKNRTDWNF